MKFLIVTAAVVLTWCLAAGVAEAVSLSHPPRGRMVDIGGRSLRLVCEGQAGGRPTVWMEAGAFSGAADFTALQDQLVAKGFRACAYDRAGMAFSDKGPSPRDGDAIVGDLEKLIAASGEAGPFILVGHSMAGLYVRQFAVRNPDKVAGVVLVEAVTPELLERPEAKRFFDTFHSIARLGAVTGTIGLTKPIYFFLSDRIGLPPEGVREKRRGFISGRQSRAALDEVEHWMDAARQAKAAGAYDPAWPVAVVTAGRRARTWDEARRAPERASKSGSFENVAVATHTSILGRDNAAVVRAVERVALVGPAGLEPATRPL